MAFKHWPIRTNSRRISLREFPDRPNVGGFRLPRGSETDDEELAETAVLA